MIEKLKILMLMDITKDAGSWVGRYWPMANYLAKLGHKIVVIMPVQDQDMQVEYSNDSNIIIKNGGRPYFGKRGGSIINYSTLTLIAISFKNLCLYLKYFLETKADVIIVCKPLPVSSTIGLFSKIFFRKKVIIDCDDYELHTNKFTSKIQAKIIQLFEYLSPKIADATIVHNSYLRDKCIASGVKRNKLHYVPNGVDPQNMNEFSKLSIMEKLSEFKKILYFGDLNLETGHNVDLLLYAYKLIIQKRDDVRLIVLGDGRDKKKLKSLAKELELENYMYWIDKVDSKIVPSYINYVDVVVDPVRDVVANKTRFPLKIIESIFLNIPVVTSDIGDRRKILGDIGVYVRPDDEKSLAAGIINCIDNIKSSEKAWKQRCSSVSSRYLWPQLTLDINEILLKVYQ